MKHFATLTALICVMAFGLGTNGCKKPNPEKPNNDHMRPRTGVSQNERKPVGMGVNNTPQVAVGNTVAEKRAKDAEKKNKLLKDKNARLQAENARLLASGKTTTATQPTDKCGNNCKAKKLAKARRERCANFAREKVIADNGFRKETIFCWTVKTRKYHDICNGDKVVPTPSNGVWGNKPTPVDPKALFPKWSRIGGKQVDHEDVTCWIIAEDLLYKTRTRTAWRSRSRRYRRPTRTAVATGPTDYDRIQDAREKKKNQEQDILIDKNAKGLTLAQRVIGTNTAYREKLQAEVEAKKLQAESK